MGKRLSESVKGHLTVEALLRIFTKDELREVKLKLYLANRVKIRDMEFLKEQR